ncbi:MAG TPA: hypothetical protein VGR57_03690 [Ktedonobacterales bacterium]|nr:hypothetical protein [Ktedonobacterales bacterium]
MDATSATILAGFGGAVLGVAVAETVHAWRDWQTTRETRWHVRVLLRREMQHNQDALRAYREALNEGEWSAAISDIDKAYALGCIAGTSPLPPCGHLMWESQAPRLADALDDDEFARLYTFHTLLDAMTDKYTQLVDVQPDGPLTVPSAEYLVHQHRTVKYWAELEDILLQLLELPVLSDRPKSKVDLRAWLQAHRGPSGSFYHSRGA